MHPTFPCKRRLIIKKGRIMLTNNLLVKSVVVALVFGLGAVSPSYAGIWDITDLENPVERFFDIHLVLNNNSADFGARFNLFRVNLVIDIDASQPGVPVAFAQGNQTDRTNPFIDLVNIVLNDAVSATLTRGGGGISQIRVEFAAGQIEHRAPEQGSTPLVRVGAADRGFARFSFDEATGVVVGSMVVSGVAQPPLGSQSVSDNTRNLVPGSTFEEF